MNSWRLGEWFWPMFEPTPTWHNFNFSQICMWIGTHNDQMWIPRGRASDCERCSNRLQLDIRSLLVNLSYELGPIMSRCDYAFRMSKIINANKKGFPIFKLAAYLCSPGPMFPGSYVPRVLCSPGPMFPGSYVPRVLCSPGPMLGGGGVEYIVGNIAIDVGI